MMAMIVGKSMTGWQASANSGKGTAIDRKHGIADWPLHCSFVR